MGSKRKLASAMIAMVFLLSQFALVSRGMELEDYTQMSADQKAVEYLELLGIIEESDSFLSEAKITKGQAAYFIVKSLGFMELSGIAGTNAIPFRDLSPEEEYAGAAVIAVNLGILSGEPDQTLRLDEDITISQAAKMLVTALGYGGRAEATGGYPTGYTMQANQLKITKNAEAADWNEKISKKFFAKMLYNSFRVEVMSLEKAGAGSATYSAVGTLEEKYLDANGFSLSEGIVEASRKTTMIDGLQLKDDNVVVVDGVRLDGNDTKIGDYIGYDIQYIADDQEQYPYPRVLRFRITEENVVWNLSRENYAEIHNGSVTFDDGESDRLETIALASDVVYLYNHRRVTSFPNDLLDFRSGVTLIDHDNDGAADVVEWTKSQSFLVENINTSNEMIYLENASYKNSASINMEESDDRIVAVRTVAGEEIDWREIGPKDAISIQESEDRFYLEIITLSKPVIGRVTSMEQGEWAEIDGVTYGISPDLLSLELNKEGKIYINEKNEIFKFESVVSEYVYLIAKGTESSLSDDFRIRIYDNFHGLKTYSFADRVVCNGKSMTNSDAFAAISAGTVVSLELNANDEVRRITSANIYGDRGKRQFCKYVNAFNDQSGTDLTPFKFDEKTLFLVVPKNNNLDDFGAIPTFKDGQYVETQAYEFDADAGTVKVVVVISDTEELASNTLGPDSDVGIVTKTGLVLDKNEQETYFVEGYSEGKEFHYDAGQYQGVFDVVGRLRAGDVIRFNRSFSDEIVNIERIMQLEGWKDFMYEGEGTTEERYFGPVMNLTKAAITNNLKYLFHQLYVNKDMDFNDMTRMDIYAHIDNTENDDYQFLDYYIYDREHKTVEPAGINDIIPYSRSSSDPSTVFIYRNISVAKGTHARIVVIVK